MDIRNFFTAQILLCSTVFGADIAARVAQNPLITVQSSPSLGDNLNGPSVIRVPGWVKNPLGRYYMYFAHHRGAFIRIAYADSIQGPWKVYEPGVMQVRDTALFRPQPDPSPLFYTHVASPEVRIDERRHRIVMWMHGYWTAQQRFPDSAADTRTWLDRNGYGQFTQAAESDDGVHFRTLPPITRESYLRVFEHGGSFYGMARLGQLLRTRELTAEFERGPNPFQGGPYENRVRHVALLKRGETLYVFFSAIGDAPERIMLSTIHLSGDWGTWKAAPAREVLAPEAAYECPTLPVEKSRIGEIEGPAKQLRDPAIFEEGRKVYLFYSICGEQGIAAAEVTLGTRPKASSPANSNPQVPSSRP